MIQEELETKTCVPNNINKSKKEEKSKQKNIIHELTIMDIELTKIKNGYYVNSFHFYAKFTFYIKILKRYCCEFLKAINMEVRF